MKLGNSSEAILVSPVHARAMLDCGQTRLYELLNSGEILSVKAGKSRRIVVASIHDYVRRLVAQAEKAA